MKSSSLVFLAIPLAVSVVACSRSTLFGESTGEGGSGGGGAGGGTTSSSSSSSSSSSTSITTAPGTCGNGLIDPGEQCDDGNGSNSDACLADCTLAVCGDGIVHVGFEQCDDANANESDACVSCAVAFCGDGFVWAGVEECDDGNGDNGDKCTNACKLNVPPGCGNGLVEAGEECDDGNATNTDACLKTCVKAKCGDGFVWAGVEPCDDGNATNTDSCVAGCVVAFCGDGFVHAGVESCDDGNADNNDGCTNACTPNIVTCGNGMLDPGEECDDANASNTDACLSTCKLAKCGDGFTQAGVEQCDDGNASNTDACVAACKLASCGDGFVQAGVEQCDDGNLANGDGCSSTCQLPICGDGALDPGEACDLGAMNADRPAFLVTWPNGTLAAKPIVSPADASLFYNYFSASGHTGFEVLNGSVLFLYANSSTKALSLFLEHGIDFTTTGLDQPQAHITMDIAGLPAASVVSLSDDTPSELFKSAATTVHGDWNFQQNSDGGVISGLPFPGTWTLTITPVFPAIISKWLFENGGAMPTPVTLSGPSAQIQAFDTPSSCRKNCTVPACGDGVLDGGEICDDGNIVSGDGCAADCKGF